MDGSFDQTLFSLVHDVAKLMRVEADKRARVHGMTRAGWSLMLRLARTPGISQKELADMLEVEPISVARMVDRLEAAGMLERRADASDRRIWRLHLLPAAEPILKKMAVMADALGSFVAEGVSSGQRDAIVEGLKQMKNNLAQKSDAGTPDAGTPNAGTLATHAIREAI